MTRLRLRTPSRLHFGLLGWGPEASRQFGGLGLMVEDPGIEISFRPGSEWSFGGPLASRVREIVGGMLQAQQSSNTGVASTPARIEVVSTASEHAGLGVGTQLSLGVARGLYELAGLPPPAAEQLAALTGRGRRSGVGLHGFRLGGLIVDGGHADRLRPPPLIVHAEFPENWSILLVQPPGPRGRHGTEEMQSFANLPPMSPRLTERLCRLVLLGILPALAENDLPSFGASLSELQQHVGSAFAPMQGGAFASPLSDAIVGDLGRIGLFGAGQSSWGPTLYAFSDRDESERRQMISRLNKSFNLGPDRLRWTRASRHGAVVEVLDD